MIWSPKAWNFDLGGSLPNSNTINNYLSWTKYETINSHRMGLCLFNVYVLGKYVARVYLLNKYLLCAY